MARLFCQHAGFWWYRVVEGRFPSRPTVVKLKTMVAMELGIPWLTKPPALPLAIARRGSALPTTKSTHKGVFIREAEMLGNLRHALAAVQGVARHFLQ